MPKWERNETTGDDVLRLSDEERIVRVNATKPADKTVFIAEFWTRGARFPRRIGYRTSLNAAKADLAVLKGRAEREAMREANNAKGRKAG